MTQTKCCPIFAFWVVVVCLSNGSSRSHRALEGSSLPSCFFPFVFLLRRSTLALRLGDSGSWQRSESYPLLCRYGRRSGPAIEFVSGKEGPASTYCRFRLLVLLLTGTRLLRVRLLGLPDVRKRPWPLRRPRGDGNGGRFVRSPCLPSWRGWRLLYVTPDAFPFLVPVQRWSIELPATTVGECRRRHSL